MSDDKLKQFKVEGDSLHLSLKALTGKEIVDVYGFITSPWGEPVFQISQILFKDGSKVWIEGEHDCPYLEHAPVTNLDKQSLEGLYDETKETIENDKIKGTH